MNSQEVLLTDLLPPTFVLTALDVYNWGPFQRRHNAVIDPCGTAIIGPTGSGKTTLVDAFMTLICAQPKYNLASTGGHESDRDLMSYVRGVSGAGNNSDSIDHISRPDKTITAIQASFDNGDKTVRIAALLWIDSASNALSDLKRAWCFSDNTSYSIDELLEVHQQGGMRALKQLGREVSGLMVSDNKKTYLAQLRRFFDVGENAFTLLNRAAGLKQINSIDDLFRELVLDDHSAFARAAQVAAEFDDLTSIHSELETARLQQRSLQPIADEYTQLNRYNKELDTVRQLQTILPIWYATYAYELWEQQLQQLSAKLASSEAQCQALNQQIHDAEQRVDTLRDIYMQSGGATIEQLQQQLDTQQQALAQCKVRAQRYQQIASALNFDNTLDAAVLAGNQQQARDVAEQQRLEFEQQQEKTFEWGAISKNHQQQVKELETEIDKITRSRSNIPSRFLEFQEELAQVLDLNTDDLPFVAELIEVKAEQKDWRGAIERAIGSHRLRLLVPKQWMKQALAWVNNRHNRLHVRLLTVQEHYAHATFLDNGFTRKLNFKQHPYREAVKQVLASLDKHCVDSAGELEHKAHGLTKQGLISGKQDYFDKQDQRRLDQDWMTGFDNRDRLANLNQELKQANSELKQAQQQMERARSACAQIESGLRLLDEIQQQQFADIDVPGLDRAIALIQQQLNAARDPNSDIAQAEKRWEQAKTELKSLRDEERRIDLQRANYADKVDSANHNKQHAFQRIGNGLTDEQKTLGDKHFKAPSFEQLQEQELSAVQKLQQKAEKINQKISSCHVNLGKYMTNAKKIDTGALNDIDTELEDIPDYLERLRVLTEEALPEKQARFLDYLNQSSDQGVTQLLMNIESEVDKIRFRIDELNQTMRRVDYQPDHYLRLDPRSVTHESLNTLKKAQQHLRYAATIDDNGETHYKALQTVVALLRDASERKRTRGAQALLDPRYRLQFSVSVIDRKTAEVIETRSGSQGGSGGEKEIIASYILTASLSYALCPEGSPTPLFGTVVLDEAFSRSSQAVAGRIIAALREFGLHPLFITPNKEIKLLRSHTRSAVLIHKKGVNSSTTSLSWEELEQQAEKQRTKRAEIAN